MTYNHTTKKISAQKSLTVGQLAQLSVEKFGLSGAGHLTHNNKQLDSSLPLRFTSLINNSKLSLEVKKSNSKTVNLVTIKLFVDGKDYISSINSALLLEEVISSFESNHSLSIPRENLQVIILNNPYTLLSIPLESIIGSNKNLVMRINYVKSASDEQERINQLQLKNQAERNQRMKREREEERLREETLKENRAREELSEETKTDAVEAKEESHEETIIDSAPYVSSEKVQKREHSSVSESTSANLPGQVPVDELTISETPSLYKPTPKKNIDLYENPDDDYSMTVNQIQAYQKSIQNSGRSIIKNKKVKKVPTKFLIRIKFPNQNILQINFVNDIENIKLGQLIKKVDELISPIFLNNYNLKYSYPPFEKIKLGFAENNKKLVDIPDFANELIVLIWETTLQSSEPYLKEDSIQIKTTSELPELVLEQHRGELPEDTNKPIKESNKSSTKTSDKKTSLKKGIPKWFKS